MSTHLEWAIRYVEGLGWSPVPLWTVDECNAGACTLHPCPNPGKHPRIKWRQLDRVTTEQVRDWWGRWPQAGIGILTGARSAVDVIDIDPKHGGDYGALRAKYDGLPDQPTVLTGRLDDGRRGGHVYVTWPSVDSTNGFATDIGVPGVDYRGDGGLVVAPPTAHATGVSYEFTTSPPTVTSTPAWLNEMAAKRRLEQEESRRRAAAVAQRLKDEPAGDPDDGNATEFGHHMVAKARTKIGDAANRSGRTGGRHDTVIAQARMLGGLIPTGHVVESFARRQLLDAATAVVDGERRDGEMKDAVDWGLARGREAPWEPEARTIDVTKNVTTITADQDVSTADRPALLADLIAAAKRYQDLPDPGHLLVSLATAATRDLDEEPVWMLLVAAPSSGKTETTRALDGIADARLDDITAAGMLSWKPAKRGQDPQPTGVLSRVGASALITLGDLSSLLASSDRGGRDQTFAMLRKAYDGHVVRDLGNAPKPLEWTGKLTVVAAVTGVIDNYAAHNDALGPRWIYYRITERDLGGRRRAAAMARRNGLDGVREHVRDLTTQAIHAARAVIANVEISDEVTESIEDAALVTCWGRAAVPRHGYGRREIDGVPIIEEPMRLLRQLRGLACGLAALDLPEGYVTALVRRVALDSMPLPRWQVLDVLADGTPLSTAAVARETGMHRHVARRQLEELEAIGVVAADRQGAEPADDDPDRRPTVWSLDGPEGKLISQVINAHRLDSGRGWHELWVPTPRPPKEGPHDPQNTNTTPTHTSCHPPEETFDEALIRELDAELIEEASR